MMQFQFNSTTPRSKHNLSGEDALIAGLWNAWQIRVMVLSSLTLQIILFSIGSRRKHIRGIWISLIVWLSYLMADNVAILALSKLSKAASQNTSSQNSNYVLTALWAPLLLLHLAGPDTITANSVEDTQLWLRHFLGLGVQLAAAIYVALKCWTGGSWLSMLTIPLFVSGIIKYGERTCALWYVNSEEPTVDNIDTGALQHLEDLRDIPDVEWPMVSYLWLQALTPYLQNYTFNIGQLQELAEETHKLANEAKSFFKLIEVQLGYIYDVIYTKAAITHTKLGCILRATGFICTTVVLVGFSIIPKDGYLCVDVSITYLLLGAAVVLEVYAFWLLICSDWGLVWMIRKSKKRFVTHIIRVLAPQVVNQTRCSNSIGQFKLLDFHTMKPRMYDGILKVLDMEEWFKKYRCEGNVSGRKYLEEKELIYEGIRRILEAVADTKPFNQIGAMVLQKYHHLNKRGEVFQKTFEECILSWHVTTEICNYSKEERNNSNNDVKYREGSIILSNYVMHLLANRPDMLRITTGDEAIRNTCTEIKGAEESSNQLLILSKLSNVPREVLHGVSQKQTELQGTVLDSRWLADILKENYPEKMWQITFDVWVEILCYGAVHCQVDNHAQQLSKGGELLTHVWLLLTILGFTEKVGQQQTSLLSVARMHGFGGTAIAGHG